MLDLCYLLLYRVPFSNIWKSIGLSQSLKIYQNFNIAPQHLLLSLPWCKILEKILKPELRGHDCTDVSIKLILNIYFEYSRVAMFHKTWWELWYEPLTVKSQLHPHYTPLGQQRLLGQQVKSEQNNDLDLAKTFSSEPEAAADLAGTWAGCAGTSCSAWWTRPTPESALAFLPPFRHIGVNG